MNKNHSQYKHGWSRSRLYKVYMAMRARCYNENRGCYPNYGGRGIIVSGEWDTFEPFRDWAMDNGYSDELSIDRIDTDGNYEPDNCRWADAATQMRNRRVVKLDEAKVVDIRKRAAKGESRKVLASLYGVHTATIGKIVRGDRWA